MIEDEAREKLKIRLRELENLNMVNTDAQNVVELDQSKVGRLSRMDALQAQALAQETVRRRKLECAGIKAALKRLDEGEWGYCLKCGEEIGDGRLEINLAAVTCATCAGR